VAVAEADTLIAMANRVDQVAAPADTKVEEEAVLAAWEYKVIDSEETLLSKAQILEQV
jgi:hypothetical protein